MGYVYKFSAEQVVTKIKDIVIQVGRTGAITCCKSRTCNSRRSGCFKLNFITKMKLEKKILELEIPIKFRRAGDVIPQVVSVDLSSRDNNKKFIFLKIAYVAITKKEISKNTKKKMPLEMCKRL